MDKLESIVLDAQDMSDKELITLFCAIGEVAASKNRSAFKAVLGEEIFDAILAMGNKKPHHLEYLTRGIMGAIREVEARVDLLQSEESDEAREADLLTSVWSPALVQE